ncbi:hypothetical protein PSECIP111951_02678 [Pseudoalteromonas holothuriae]|uniref:Uncharacterized protein n=1 Tax=Pseudoalteromonas holothuriae TaxID=2963714 RepID=A0A9W4VXU7_9GAMM|nr:MULTISPECIES: hypothetical protein [unclassified Pseudoalteromonas]CAH9054839.1 hypothetical protein PSECIP111854_01456 [Pseudoalteromonas sp. CIP111854]CAH9062382.1 hypothetical protein PSECIP111951_02678 [Pseudoalteromonas sp. CIP111951]
MNKVIFFAVIAFVVAAIYLNNNFNYIQHGDAKFVYDESSIDNALAQQIHQYLLNNNAYKDKTGEIFLLKKTPSDTWIIKYPVYQGGDIAPKLLKEIETLSQGLKEQVLNNETLEVHITNVGYQSVQFFKI